MIVSNQIEHFKNLYEQLRFDEVIQFASIPLQITLKEKRYNEALVCFEYLASANFEEGNFESFITIMADYEKLCLTYGNDKNKMAYHYLVSLLNLLIREYDHSIIAAKKSIRYAYSIKSDEMLAINFANIAVQAIFLGDFEKAKMAEKFARYYKEKLPSLNLSSTRGQLGLLYYYATTMEEKQYEQIKKEMLHILGDGEYLNYRAHLALSEGILFERKGDIAQCISRMEMAYPVFKDQNNEVYLKIIARLIERLNLQHQVSFFEELEQIVNTLENDLSGIQKIQSLSSELFLSESTHPLSSKYANVVSEAEIEQHVDEALKRQESLYCLHWCFMTESIVDLFGTLFEAQFLYKLYDIVFEVIANFDSEIVVQSSNEGEAILSNISQTAFFELLMELEQKLQSVFVHSTIGRVEIPIHFGFTCTDDIAESDWTYEKLVAHADASLYYAKTQGQLYIYS